MIALIKRTYFHTQTNTHTHTHIYIYIYQIYIKYNCIIKVEYIFKFGVILLDSFYLLFNSI